MADSQLYSGNFLNKDVHLYVIIFQTLKILTNSIEKLTKEVMPSVQQATSPVATELPVITSPEQVIVVLNIDLEEQI